MTKKQKCVAINIKAKLFPYEDGSGHRMEVHAEYAHGDKGTITLQNWSDQEVAFDTQQWPTVRDTIDEMVARVSNALKN